MFCPQGEKSWLQGFGWRGRAPRAELLHSLIVLFMWTPYVPLVAGVTAWPLTRHAIFVNVGQVALLADRQLSRLFVCRIVHKKK